MITREQFIRTHWNQYLLCESDFLQLLEFVDLRESNFDTCSNRIIVQLITACSLIDSTLREMYSLSLNAGLNSMSKRLVQDNPSWPETTVRVARSHEEEMRLCPWKELGGDAKVKTPGWWDAYNDLKHSRFAYYDEGTLCNLLHSLAGLYTVEMLYAKAVGDHWYAIYGYMDDMSTADIPNDVSHVFEIAGWETREHVSGFETYAASQEALERKLKSLDEVR